MQSKSVIRFYSFYEQFSLALLEDEALIHLLRSVVLI